jgi:hypothetical protein
MDPRLTLQPSSLPYHSAPSLCYNAQGASAFRSQVEYLLANIQSNQTDEGLNIRGKPFLFEVRPVLTCRFRIRIPAHLTPRPEYDNPSVTVKYFRRYALVYIFVYSVCV